MARQRMVTRTVLVTELEVMCVNVNTAEVSINEYKLSGTSYDKETAMKSLKKQYETDSFKLVNIQSINESEVLYGMTEEEFIELARVLPPRNYKTDSEEQ